jgi:hypothetical protein
MPIFTFHPASGPRGRCIYFPLHGYEQTTNDRAASQHSVARPRTDCEVWLLGPPPTKTGWAERAMSGYRRLAAHGIGAGAAEILRVVVDGSQSRAPADAVGTVHRVFDRSFYIQFDAEHTAALDIPGPRLVVIGGPTFSGPLSLRVQPDAPRGFEPDQLSTGTPCRLRAATTTEGRGTVHVLATGDALEIEFEARLLEAQPTTSWPTVKLESIHPESHVWRYAAEAVAGLIESEATDGLGWLDHLQQVTESPSIPDEFVGLVQGCIEAVQSGWDGQPPESVHELLGRGPGATPSGDDILAGLFLMLVRTTTGAARRRVRHAGDELVELADNRTTSISTALLAQAMRGRAADPILEAREALLTPEMGLEDRRAALSDIRSIGHTSGLDTLVGMLVALLYIGPNLARSE